MARLPLVGKLQETRKKNLVNRKEVSNGKRGKEHSRKFCDRENKRTTRWDVCNATKVEVGPGLQQGARERKKNIPRRRRVGVRRHKSQGTRISIGWRNPTLIDGDLKKSEYQEGISGLNKGIERVITYEHFSVCCLQW